MFTVLRPRLYHTSLHITHNCWTIQEYLKYIITLVFAAEDSYENATKQIVEMLNAGDYDAGDLLSALRIERNNRKEVFEIIEDVWPEIVTDRARHGFCEALVETDVRPQIICEEIYLPWVCTYLKMIMY